jgi:hypothetical protein
MSFKVKLLFVLVLSCSKNDLEDLSQIESKINYVDSIQKRIIKSYYPDSLASAIFFLTEKTGIEGHIIGNYLGPIYESDSLFKDDIFKWKKWLKFQKDKD